MRKQDRDYCNNHLKNIEIFKDQFSKFYYNNHKGSKYNETPLNEIDRQP